MTTTTELMLLRPAQLMQEGAGAQVQRLFPVVGFMHFDPFVLWDHFQVTPGNGFPDHPHRGFEAITYMFHGSMRHTDNLGNSSTVTPGGAQRFTAGQGLVHSEMPGSEGINEGIQLWINLPRRLKTLAPDYQQVDVDDFPLLQLERGCVRTLVGEGSPLRLHTPVCYQELQLDRGGEYEHTLPSEWRGLLYVVGGQIRVGEQVATAGQACFAEDIDKLHITADVASHLMLCFGQPYDEPIHQHGPFVD
jgi:hypothetical protein